VLANSGTGTNSTGTATLQFTDGTSNTTTLYAPDWYNGTANVAWFGPGLVNLSSGADNWGPENPCFYQTTINVSALPGSAGKSLASITFGKANARSTAIYAVSGSLLSDTPALGTPISATGWNRDVIVENTALAAPYTNYAAELAPGEGTAFYQTGLAGTANGLPASGNFASAVDGTIFQLQPYTSSNALVLSQEAGITNGTLTPVSPAVFNTLSVLANSAAGGGTPNVTITFSDNSTLVTNFSAPDWFSATPNEALSGFDRINLTTGAADGAPSHPGFFQTTYNLAALFGATNKAISKVTFNQASGASVTAIYALSGVPVAGYALATLTNAPAAAIQTRGATLGGVVTSTGGAAPDTLIYFGTNDGGTNGSAWAHYVETGAQGAGAFSQNVTGLSVNTTYYFRAAAINPAGISWAPASQAFTTAAASLPVLTNLPPVNVSPATALISGSVLATGGDPPAVTLYYGSSNGGSNASAWQNSVALPEVQNAWFGAPIGNLAANSAYFYTAAGSNAAGVTWAAPVQTFTTPASNSLRTNLVSVLTGRNDNGRTGQNTNETILTPANVSVNTFGRLFSYPLDGCMVTQPLVMAGVSIPGKGTHDIVFAATENDSVYAFDADSNAGANAAPLWRTSFIDPAVGITTVSSTVDLQASSSPGFYGPQVGISGTPVIDAVTGTLYVEASTREITNGVTNFVHRLHALDVTTGAEKFGGPAVISGAVPGYGDGFDAFGMVNFLPGKHMNRPALLLVNGMVCVTFTSHQDFPPYHGWVFVYNAYTLQLEGLFNTTPNGSAGGLWQGTSGPAADASGNIYFESGNGTFDAANGNYGDAVVKLSTQGGLTLADYFAPYNQLALNLQDLDIGSAGMILLPDAAGSAAHPHLALAGSKTGTFWLLDREDLGHYNPAGDTQIVQEISGAVGGMWVTPAYFNNTVYYCGANDYAKAFAVSNAVVNSTPISKSANTIHYPGSSLSVSANGTRNAIVWGLDTSANQSGPAVLHAYNATNLATELYNSGQNAARDNAGLAIKFTMPTIANGKVYVGTANYLSVFGNLSYLPPPVITPSGGVFTNFVTVSLQSPSNGVSIYYTLDGSVPTTNSLLYTGPFAISNSGNVLAVTALAGQPNSAVASAAFLNSGSLSPYASAVVNAVPLAYWPLGETTGSTAYDIVGGHNGTYLGNVALGQSGPAQAGFGPSSGSVLFDGSSAYVDVPEGPFNLTNALTAVLWVKIPNVPAHFSGLMGHGDTSWRTSVNTSGDPGAADGSAPDATSPLSIADSGWHMIAYTYTGSSGASKNGALYVDGALQTNNTVTVPAGNALDVWIGGSPDYGTQRLLAGNIAHAAIFNKALSAPQIMGFFNAASTAPPVTLNIASAGQGALTLTWLQGALLQSTNVNGPWTTNKASSPLNVAPTNLQMFFKVQVH
jgi:hypothetical protein